MLKITSYIAIIYFSVCIYPLAALDYIDDQIKYNIVDMGSVVYSPDKQWKLSMVQRKEGEEYSLIISNGKSNKIITTSSKPDNRIVWSDNGKYFVVIKPVGFCTMVDVFSLNGDNNSVNQVFSSEKYNQRSFVDYKIQYWDLINKNVVFNVVQNSRYLEGKKPRLFEIQYVFLDGDNGYDK